MAHPQKREKALEVLNHFRNIVEHVSYKPPPAIDLLHELGAFIDVLQLPSHAFEVDAETGDAGETLTRCSATLLPMGSSLFKFALETTAPTRDFRSWHAFRYETLSIADCVYIVRGFKSGFMLSLAATARKGPLRAHDRLEVRGDLLPSRKSRSSTGGAPEPRRICMGDATENATVTRNTMVLDVRIVPAPGAGRRTTLPVKADAPLIVVCAVDGIPWRWEGCRKDFSAAWNNFVVENAVSDDSICKLSVSVVSPPQGRTAVEGQVQIMSADALAASEAGLAFRSFRLGAQGQEQSDVEIIRKGRMAKFGG
ncbi:hypothetical protein CcaCcLH18_12000 [Colletotrichum camelliae]|nr:hypothetical protein CcaCcLH18_12000 [Colletotrichum camelliae]